MPRNSWDRNMVLLHTVAASYYMSITIQADVAGSQIFSSLNDHKLIVRWGKIAKCDKMKASKQTPSTPSVLCNTASKFSYLKVFFCVMKAWSVHGRGSELNHSSSESKSDLEILRQRHWQNCGYAIKACPGLTPNGIPSQMKTIPYKSWFQPIY